MTHKVKKLSIFSLILSLIIIALTQLDLGTHSDSPQGQVQGTSQENLLQVTFFDIGQGDSALINTPNNKQILIDGGPDNSILEKLSSNLDWNDTYIDVVVLTHPHSDHVDGLVSVLQRYEVGEIWLTGVVHTSNKYLEFLNLIKEKNILTKNIFTCHANQPDCVDEIAFEPSIKITFLWPIENMAGKKVDNLNNSSITFRLEHGENSFLFTGDIEKEAEHTMVDMYDNSSLSSDILKIAHHGSSTSSLQEVLALVVPKYAVISSGKV